MPVLQAKHEDILDAPVVAEYLPRGHDKQSTLPLSYFPAGQLVHIEDEKAPTFRDVDPGGHDVHDEEPDDDAYLPATHAVQLSMDVTPCELYLPRGHDVHVAAPELEYCPDTQLVQYAAAVAPVALDEVPAGHREHELEATVLAYLPGEQNKHIPWEVAPDCDEYVPNGHGEQTTDPAVE